MAPLVPCWRNGSGGINPDESQLRTLLQSGHEGPLQFVNLLAYRGRADYPEGCEYDSDSVCIDHTRSASPAARTASPNGAQTAGSGRTRNRRNSGVLSAALSAASRYAVTIARVLPASSLDACRSEADPGCRTVASRRRNPATPA